MTAVYPDEHIDHFLNNVTQEIAENVTHQWTRFLVGDDNPTWDGIFEFCSTSVGGSMSAAERVQLRYPTYSGRLPAERVCPVVRRGFFGRGQVGMPEPVYAVACALCTVPARLERPPHSTWWWRRFVKNMAKAWTFKTTYALGIDQDIDHNLLWNQWFEWFRPTYRPEVPENSVEDFNDIDGYLDRVKCDWAGSQSGKELDIHPPLKGIKILLQHVAKGAMHNSGERFDAPTCHPETRIALQDDVSGWVDEPPGGQLVTWMYGPAGAGKSAIAQTVSLNLQAKGQLTASFFFSRTSTSNGRGDETALIATLAYQLLLSVPATKESIARAVHKNQLIFDLSLDEQVQTLIVTPLTVAYQDYGGLPHARVIVVDGLDECRKDDNAQSRVVSALIKGFRSIPKQSQKLFITSRPEHHIKAIFRDLQPELLRKMELNDKWNPDDDIRAFLNSAFADIRRSHPYFEGNPTDQTWPSRSEIDELVARSSGQFIYASVVIKYIKSEDNYDPAARLEVILKLQNNEDRPYAELDALYEHIFSQIRAVEKVLVVLSLERMFLESRRNALFSPFLSVFVGARIQEIKFWFRPLVSLLVWEKDKIRYMHASLPDFLADEGRSNTFYIYSTSIATRIVRRALELLQDEDTLLNDNLLFVLPMRAILPFLRNATSPEYIQAQESAEANWIETKRDLYDPILSIRVEQLPNLTKDEEEYERRRRRRKGREILEII
ncbi:hypothetical protein D9619_000204 [Psilocybe cf. subviscida]|uniref:NACHT domain-containing protein n=1 Tax=Psilocybe cf. subviscida TaxID=2480587 RepID=A0A8H5F3J1_9AGAR|nr:hypothetical protein D9619_000204 [Psilocybe cf. subviscida]